MLQPRLIHAIVVVALLVTGPFVCGDRALAIQDSEDKVWFGAIGIGAGQAARISVYGLCSSSTGGTVPPPPVPWEFTVRIFNRRGDMVQERQFQSAAGVIASFEINIGNPNEFPIERLGRRTLRAEIVGFDSRPDPPRRFAATLEVYSPFTGHSSIELGAGPEIESAGAGYWPPERCP